MFGLCPSAPTRPEDYAVDRIGRPLRNARVKPRGLTPRRIAQWAGAGRRGAEHVTPCPWVPEPALVLTDVVAGSEPWMGILLDPTPAAAGADRQPDPQRRANAGAPLARVARCAAAAAAGTRGDGSAVGGRLSRRARHGALRPRARRGRC